MAGFITPPKGQNLRGGHRRKFVELELGERLRLLLALTAALFRTRVDQDVADISNAPSSSQSAQEFVYRIGAR